MYSDLFVLTTTLIYNNSLQWLCEQLWSQTHNIRNICDSQAYTFRFIILEKNTYNTYKLFERFESHIKIHCLSYCYIYKKRRKKTTKQKAKQTHDRLLSIVVFVRESYLFCETLSHV